MDKEEKKEINYWTYYTRNDQYVKEQFTSGKYDMISTTGLANFDGLFSFLCEIDFFSLFNFRPDCRKRVMIPLVYLLSTYSLKVICELDSLNRVDSELFRDRALLHMIGFTGVHLKEGFSKRNKKKHLPFNITTLGKLLGDFSLSQTEALFTNSLSLLGKKKFISKGVFAVDATPLYVSNCAKEYENTGTIVKDGKKRKGYKLITLKYVGEMRQQEDYEGYDKKPGIFVAAIVVPLNHQDSPYLIPLIKQAIKNIGQGKIKMIVADRGFFSGENLWMLKHQFKIDFIIYSKSNMDVTGELKKKMVDYNEREQKKLPLPKSYFLQKDIETEVYGFNNLNWFWTYGDKQHHQDMKKKLYKKNSSFKTHPISGGIITKYKGEKKTYPITFLSSKRFGKNFTPLLAVYLYRKRHHIENEGFRELKQGYKIGKFPSRKFSGVYFHIIFTLLIYNFISCYKTIQGKKIASLGLKRLHTNMIYHGVIIYCYPHYGVFDVDEMVGWFGITGTGLRAPP